MIRTFLTSARQLADPFPVTFKQGEFLRGQVLVEVAPHLLSVEEHVPGSLFKKPTDALGIILQNPKELGAGLFEETVVVQKGGVVDEVAAAADFGLRVPKSVLEGVQHRPSDLRILLGVVREAQPQMRLPRDALIVLAGVKGVQDLGPLDRLMG